MGTLAAAQTFTEFQPAGRLSTASEQQHYESTGRSERPMTRVRELAQSFDSNSRRGSSLSDADGSTSSSSSKWLSEEEHRTLSRSSSVAERAAMFQRESDPPADPSGGGGRPAHRGGAGRHRSGDIEEHQPGGAVSAPSSRQQRKQQQHQQQQQQHQGEGDALINFGDGGDKRAGGGAHQNSPAASSAASASGSLVGSASANPSPDVGTVHRDGMGVESRGDSGSSYASVLPREEEDDNENSNNNNDGNNNNTNVTIDDNDTRSSSGSRRSSTGSDDDDDGDGMTSLDSTPRRTDGEMDSRSSSFSVSPYSADGAGGGDGSRKFGGGGRGGDGSSSRSTGRKDNSSSSISPPPAYSMSRTGRSPAAPSPQGTRVGRPGPESGGSSPAGSGDVRPIPGVSTRPGGVPFGASALSKTQPNNGRARPRGLRPRSSFGSTPGVGGQPQLRSGLTPPSSQRPGSNGRVSGGGFSPPRHEEEARGAGVAGERERRAAEVAAPGVSLDVVVRAAVRIESVMRVLIARGYVRRKLVSEVTAFSLIMERGIEVIKHPFSGKAKPKNVTVNFVSRKGAMQVSWGGKSGVPLETIYGVTKGIKTDALQRVVGPDRAENCFSLLTPDRTIDFEVDNPWLVLLVVRALRLFLGAHYDTLPAPTFFSHLCVRPRGRGHAESPRQTLVWTGSEKMPPGKEQPTSTPTERTSGDSASDDSERGGGRERGGNDSLDGPFSSSSGRAGGGGRSPWDADVPATAAAEVAAGRVGADSDCESSFRQSSAAGHSPPGAAGAYPPAPADQAPGASTATDGDGDEATGETDGVANGEDAAAREAPTAEPAGDVYDEGDEDELSSDRSPGGIMALFSSGRRTSEEMSSAGAAATGGAGEEPLTASQLLATRGMSKRLSLSKKLSAANATGGPLKGKRFDLMALPMDQTGHQERRERGINEHAEAIPKRNQGMSISIGAGYQLPEEQNRGTTEGESHNPERMAVVDDLNDKLQSLRKLCVPQQRIGVYRPSRAPKTMAVKHMAFFQGAGGTVVGGGMGSLTDMWGDGVRRQYQTDMVRQQDQSVEDVRKRDDVRTAMLVNRSGVHRVTRKATSSESR